MALLHQKAMYDGYYDRSRRPFRVWFSSLRRASIHPRVMNLYKLIGYNLA